MQHVSGDRTVAARGMREQNLSGGVRAPVGRAHRVCAMLLFLLFGCGEAAAESPHMVVGENALSPMAFTDFCLRKPARCAPSKEIRPIALDDRNLQLLDIVNRIVNHSILPYPAHLETPWRDDAEIGNCVEYALAKRSQLLDLNFPASALLFGLAIAPGGEAHLVLIAVTDQGDFVLDSLTDSMVRWDKTKYRWVSRSSPKNPQFWQTVVSPRSVLGMN